MKKAEFIKMLDAAIEEHAGIKVFIQMPDLPKPEIICNPAANVLAKKEYYDKAYDVDMKLKSFDKIRITGVQFIHIGVKEEEK